MCFERASRRWILRTIVFVPFDHSTAGVAHPAVFDSEIIAGRNPAILFTAGWFFTAYHIYQWKLGHTL